MDPQSLLQGLPPQDARRVQRTLQRLERVVPGLQALGASPRAGEGDGQAFARALRELAGG